MSKLSRRPEREEIKALAKKKHQQKKLRQQPCESGLNPHQKTTPSNCTSPYQTKDEEQAG